MKEFDMQNDFVLIQPFTDEKIGELWVANDSPPCMGTVEAASAWSDFDKGEVILFFPGQLSRIRTNTTSYYVLPESAIIAVVDESEDINEDD